MFGRHYFGGRYFGGGYFGDGGSGVPGGVGAAAVWAFLMPDGRTAAQVLMDTNAKVDELWREHGLDILNPLTVTPTARGAGPLQQQSISEAGETITVQRLP